MQNGTSCYSTNSSLGASNETISRSESIRNTGKAIKSKKPIDIPGQFVHLDGTVGLKGVLTEVNFHEEVNFNLLSLSHLLKKG